MSGVFSILGSATKAALAGMKAAAERSFARPREGWEVRAALTTDAFAKARAKGFYKPQMMNVVQWTETYRQFGDLHNSTGSSVRVSELEVCRGPMLWVTEPGVRRIYIMACTQSGKTFLMECVAGRAMHLDPGPILYVGATIQDAIDWIGEKFMKMVEASRVLRPLVNTSRTSGNRNDYKRFPGGRIRGVGTETRVGFTNKGDRYLLVDEVDGHGTAGDNGDTIELALSRKGDYEYNYLLLAVSSPVTKRRFHGDVEVPTIWKLFKSADERLPFVQCQQCGHDHVMLYEREGLSRPTLHIPKRDDDERGTFEPERAIYACPKNGCVNDQRDRLRMLREGAIHWRATKPFKCCGVHQDPMKRWEESDQTAEDYARWWQPYGEPLGVEPVGYGDRGVCRAKCEVCGKMPVSNEEVSGHYGRYYRPQFTLAEMASAAVRMIRDPSKRRAFRNTVLGLPDEDSASKRITVEHLAEQGERWESKATDPERPHVLPDYLVPDPVAMMSLGIDIQKGAEDGSGSRFAIERVGWGVGEESWSLSYDEPEANTRDLSEWDRVLIPEIERAFHRRDGRAFLPMVVCIDAGNNADQAAGFVSKHQLRLRARGIFLFAVKGIGDRGTSTYRTWAGAAKDAAAFNRFADGSVKLWNVGNREAKDTIAAHLAVPNGPGAVHFPHDRTELWVKGLLSETQVMRGGRLAWVHVDKSVRNEPLDCRMYSLAGLRAIQAMYPAWSLEWQAQQVGATTSRIPTADDDAGDDDDDAPGSAIADAAVRLHGALTALAAREGSAASQSSPTPTVPKPVPVEVEPEEPWIAETGWHAPVMPWD